ncbi:hypothetical protein CEXT_276391 [Caerostris extrusa]|uniref:Uncharacterized protein n=1 Tax=Caerostris extrusa TaxID=172846 RepID=A0AAV4Y931_CAEEX|nr:hypothetical protein CEXT_276391 [Caerostris extrusa]
MRKVKDLQILAQEAEVKAIETEIRSKTVAQTKAAYLPPTSHPKKKLQLQLAAEAATIEDYTTTARSNHAWAAKCQQAEKSNLRRR